MGQPLVYDFTSLDLSALVDTIGRSNPLPTHFRELSWQETEGGKALCKLMKSAAAFSLVRVMLLSCPSLS